jgi:glycosyltransferase involved in cell wall biosynthesis
MPGLRVLYDGWPLVYQAGSPAALHLFEILSGLPAEVEAIVALPGDAPPWLPPAAQPQVWPAAPTPGARLEWEQRRLPALQRKLGAGLLHLTTPHPALFSGLPALVSPAEADTTWRPGGLADRLREALAAGGLARQRLGLLWPADLPALENQRNLRTLPPFPGLAAYASLEQVPTELPDRYILYHGPGGERHFHRLLEAWSWAAGAIGADTPLLLVGLDLPQQDELAALAGEYGLGESLRSLPALPPGCLAALYRGCAALFHPAEVAPWGSPLRLALACGRPAVALETRLADALVGPAAYLVKPGDGRGLGAALLTTVVEEDVATRLSQAALARAGGWQAGRFGPRLLEVYQELATEKP